MAKNSSFKKNISKCSNYDFSSGKAINSFKNKKKNAKSNAIFNNYCKKMSGPVITYNLNDL